MRGALLPAELPCHYRYVDTQIKRLLDNEATHTLRHFSDDCFQDFYYFSNFVCHIFWQSYGEVFLQYFQSLFCFICFSQTYTKYSSKFFITYSYFCLCKIYSDTRSRSIDLKVVVTKEWRSVCSITFVYKFYQIADKILHLVFEYTTIQSSHTLIFSKNLIIYVLSNNLVQSGERGIRTLGSDLSDQLLSRESRSASPASHHVYII